MRVFRGAFIAPQRRAEAGGAVDMVSVSTMPRGPRAGVCFRHEPLRMIG